MADPARAGNGMETVPVIAGPACCHPSSPKNVWIQPFSITLFAVGLLYLLSVFVPSLRLFRHHFNGYFSRLWFPLLIGFSVSGLIGVYVPRAYVNRLLSGKSPKTIFIASVLGFLFSACSHGCLAIAIEL